MLSTPTSSQNAVAHWRGWTLQALQEAGAGWDIDLGVRLKRGAGTPLIELRCTAQVGAQQAGVKYSEMYGPRTRTRRNTV